MNLRSNIGGEVQKGCADGHHFLRIRGAGSSGGRHYFDPPRLICGESSAAITANKTDKLGLML